MQAMTSSALSFAHNADSTILTVPPTQNTAPIHEYRCLYTYDLKRKQKRWQDGVLRFHTFNKRVMVYDIPRNYIGDSHWRNSHPVQDGDEFELDRGVLVQVGDLVGSLDQDLTELLERRKKAPEVQVQENAMSRTAASTAHTISSVAKAPMTQTSQLLRPKPLNAVLGMPRGPIGRASLPTKSPHAQRMERENLEWPIDRPAKRTRRVMSRPENQAIPRAPQLLGEPRSNQRSTADRTYLAASLHPRRDEVHDAYAQEHSSKEKSVAEERSKMYTRELHKGVTVEPSYANMYDKLQGKKPKASWKSARKDAPDSAPWSRQPSSNLFSHSTSVRDSRRDTEELSNGERSEDSGKTKARMKLQVASRQPRKKLMYGDLLPQGIPKLVRTNHEFESLSGLHQEEEDRLEDRLKRQLAKRKLDQMVDDATVENNAPGEQGSPPPADGRGFPSGKHHRTKRKISKSNDVQDRVAPLIRSRSTSVEGTNPPILARRSKPDATGLALSTMDEILLSHAHLQERPLASPIMTLPQKPCGHNEPSPDASETQVPSSPGFQTQRIPSRGGDQSIEAKDEPTRAVPLSLPSTGPELAALDEYVIVSSEPSGGDDGGLLPRTTTACGSMVSMRPTPDVEQTSLNPGTRDLVPGEEDRAASTPEQDSAPAPPVGTKQQLPSFKQPTRRSPLKKTISDTSSVRPSTHGPTSASVLPAQAGLRNPHTQGSEHASNPWSREAWDLFGCGRDGVECGFANFLIKEQLE
ncbi:MAG: hypothetical protein Q9163_006442 [Psora crenata]